MTDKKDDYYQPWLRDPAPTPAAKPTPAPAGADEGLAKPRETPPIGVDVSRYAVDETPPRARAVTDEQLKSGAGGAWRAVRKGAAAFADWTIAIGARADIPARVETMEIPRRSRELARRCGDMAVRTARAVGRGSGRAGRAVAAAGGTAWQKMALGDKVGRLSSEAQRGLGDMADKTRAGIGSAAKAGRDSLGEAATKLRPPRRAAPTPPPSGLDQLLAREAETDPPPRGSAPDLPLFARKAGAVAAADAAAPLAPVLPAEKVTAAATAAPDDRTLLPPRAETPRVTEVAPSGLAKRGWSVALGAILLLAGAYWLGDRFGGGMSRSEVEAVVADYVRTHPEIIPEALEAQRKAEIAKAIDAVRPALERPYAGAWAGNADGDVTLVLFTDYACGFCRASVPDVDRLLRTDAGVKVVFRELPIIAPQSRDAALMALAAARQGKYDAFHHAMFAAPALDNAAIAAAAARAGVVTDGSADATADAALLQREINGNLAIAQQLQLNATPTWIVGDELLQGQIGFDGLRAAVARARAKA